MVNRARRSRSLRRVNYNTPGGENKVRFENKANSPARCGGCGEILKGVPRDVSRLSKTQKRPERPFGGVLCSPCMRSEIKTRVRV